MKKARRRFTRAFKMVPFGLFTTDHTETRFAGRGRQFEKSSFGFDTGNPSTLHGFRAWDRWMCGAKISNRLPRPAEPVSEPSVVKISPGLRRLTRSTWRHGGTEGMGGWLAPGIIQNP